ncbi:MAG: hypothetical protein P1V51_18460 [Deltaproteobacteria bacterium]|nr:hypothetical protein [Deltaproteobacteria bacterium]
MPGYPRVGRLFLCLVTLVAACASQAEAPAETWTDRMGVEVRTVEKGEGEAGELQVVLAPKEGWSINTAYPGVKVELAESVPAEKRVLKKDDGAFEGEKPGDKADRLVLSTRLSGPAPAKVEGSYKAVICTKASCSPPFTGTFSLAPAGAKAE